MHFWDIVIFLCNGYLSLKIFTILFYYIMGGYDDVMCMFRRNMYTLPRKSTILLSMTCITQLVYSMRLRCHLSSTVVRTAFQSPTQPDWALSKNK